MKWEFNNEKPIYIQLVDKLTVAILSGVFPSSSKLPSVRDLALMIKVNPNTVQKALSDLEDKRLIYTERTNGKYVTSDKKLIDNYKQKLAKEKVKNYLDDMKSIGIDYNESIKYLKDLGGKK